MRFQLRAIAALSCMAAVLPGCQGGAKNGSTAPAKEQKYGGSLHADPSGGKFVISGNKGTFNVEMGAAPVADRANKAIAASELKKGALVIVTGIAEGDDVKASTIQVIRLNSDAPTVPAAAGSSPGG